MGEIVHDGFWWDPREPERRWGGTLRFSANDGAILTVLVPTEEPVLFPPLRSYDIILGVTTAPKPVTLFRCFDRTTRGALYHGVPRNVEIFANAFVVGFHSNTPNPPISTVSVSFRSLDTWWGASSIRLDPNSTWPAVAVHYTPPPPIVLYETESLRVTVRSALSASSGNYLSSLREEILVDIEAPQARPLHEVLRLVAACGDFFSIASLAIAHVDELLLTQPAQADRESSRGTYHASPHYRKDEHQRRSPARCLFRLADLQDRARAVFTAWLDHAELLRRSRALYFSGAYGEGFVEARFLPLSQAVEAFHRCLHGGLYMDQAAYDERVLPPLRAAIPTDLDRSHRQALAARLKWGNEFSLRRRLTDLVADHDAALACVTGGDPRRFVDPIVSYRNDFTHHPTGEQAIPRDERFGEDVVRLNYVLRSLLEFCFLKVMGFSAAEIQSFVQRCETYRQIRARFFSGADP